MKTVSRKGDGNNETVEEKKEFPYSSGVTEEFAAFAKTIEAGKIDALQTPAEALKDVKILQRLLELGAGGATVKSIGA